MKLLIATPLFPPEVGGPATYTKELLEGLPQRGIEVTIVKFSDVRHLPKLLRHYVYYRKLLRELGTSDLLLALDPVSVGLPAMKAAKKLGKPFVVKVVGDYAWEQGVQRFGVTQSLDEFVEAPQNNFFVRKLQKIQTEVARAATKVLVPSPYLKNIVIQWGIAADKITVINNAVTLPRDIPARSKSKEFLVVSAGRRVPWKGFEALEALRASHPNWQVEIISGRPREEVLSWMKAADVFVLNSLYEGFPHALVEAMSLGTPIIATDTQANRHVAGEFGLFVPVKDNAALEHALIEVEQDPAGAKKRAEGGQEKMKEFDLKATLDTTATFLQTCVS